MRLYFSYKFFNDIAFLQFSMLKSLASMAFFKFFVYCQFLWTIFISQFFFANLFTFEIFIVTWEGAFVKLKTKEAYKNNQIKVICYFSVEN